MTNKRWPWKSEFSKDCVTTHCSNRITPKMNGDQPYHRSFSDGGDNLTSI